MFGSDQEVAGVMASVRRRGAAHAFSWVGSDGWSARARRRRERGRRGGHHQRTASSKPRAGFPGLLPRTDTAKQLQEPLVCR